MKINENCFVVLASWIAAYAGRRMDVAIVEDLRTHVHDCMPTPEPQSILRVEYSVVDDLLRAVKEDRKIEAIKAYRIPTGCGLKESKDAVEHNTVSWQVKEDQQRVARNEVLQEVIDLIRNKDEFILIASIQKMMR